MLRSLFSFFTLVAQSFAQERQLDLVPQLVEPPNRPFFIHLNSISNLVLASAATSSTNFFLIDASANPPRVVGGCKVWGTAIQASSDGAYAYVCSMGEGIQVVDMRDISKPVAVVSRFGVAGEAYRCRVEGALLYVAAGTGLQVVDISNPSSPKRLQRLPLSGNTVWDVEVAGDYAYLTTAGTDLHIVDVRDRRAPVFVKTITLGGSGRSDDVEVIDGKAYVTLDEGGLRILDLAVPATPRLIGQIEGSFSFRPISIIVHEGFAFMSTRSSGMHVYDVRNPAQITYAGILQPNSSRGEVGLTMASGKLFYSVSTAGPLVAVTPQPAVAGILMLESAALSDGRTNLLVFGYRMQEIATADPTALQAVRTHDTPNWLRRPVLSDEAAVQVSVSSLSTYERKPDDSFELRGMLDVGFGPWSPSMLLKDDHVLLPRRSGLQIINIADLARPRLTTTLTNWSSVANIIGHKDLAAISAQLTTNVCSFWISLSLRLHRFWPKSKTWSLPTCSA